MFFYDRTQTHSLPHLSFSQEQKYYLPFIDIDQHYGIIIFSLEVLVACSITQVTAQLADNFLSKIRQQYIITETVFLCLNICAWKSVDLWFVSQSRVADFFQLQRLVFGSSINYEVYLGRSCWAI